MKKSLGLKIFYITISSFLIVYGIFWLFSLRAYPISYGISFNEDYATFLGLDWKKTYLATLDELKPKYIRLSAMWNKIEPSSKVYDFFDLDWMMAEAKKRNTKVLLVVGQKVPRWPECFIPEWFKYSSDHAREVFLSYVRAVILRYKDNSALERWQMENEPFIRFSFGECVNFHEDWVTDEVALVRSIDSVHPIVITDSGELGLYYQTIDTGDILGTTLYRVVRTPGGTHLRYWWLPPAYYKFKARIVGADFDKFNISELQAEPWFIGSNASNTPIAEQEKSMNPNQLQANIDYAAHVGASRAYFWGAEWWYFMKQKHNDSRYWDVAKASLQF